MSFQDVKPSSRDGARRPGEKSGLNSSRSYAGLPGRQPSTSSLGSRSGLPAGGGHAALSDGLLAYRRHVDLLQRMVSAVGSGEDTADLQAQIRLQTDVCRQHGSRIERQLAAAERAGGGDAQGRAQIAKLSRDYRRVDANLRAAQADVKRRRGLAEARRREQAEAAQRDMAGAGAGDSAEEAQVRMQMQVQLQGDNLAEEIMRERAEEISNINRGMSTVNQIYKDLANIVGGQQDEIDMVEDQMEHANRSANRGLTQIEKANANADKACIVS